MKTKLRHHSASAALIVSVVALIASMSGVSVAQLAGSPSTKPRPNGLLLLNKKKQFPPSVIPYAKNSKRLGGKSLSSLEATCSPGDVDLGTFCIMSIPVLVLPADAGKNNYFYATQRCAELGGYLPTAAQLIGAATRVKLSSTVDDSAGTALIDENISDGVKDRREMSATLVTTAAGSTAAGSQGVTTGSRGNPNTGEPDPVPLPANPSPETLQYVTVYDNGDKGGFAGSKPVGQPENFRCAFGKVQKSSQRKAGS